MSEPVDDTVVPVDRVPPCKPAEPVKPPIHTPNVPHSIRGDGLVTECPPECARHALWAKERARPGWDAPRRV